MTIYNWFSEFKRARVDLSDEFRDVCPSTAVNNKNIEAVRHMIETDRHVTYHEIWAFLEFLHGKKPLKIGQFSVVESKVEPQSKSEAKSESGLDPDEIKDEKYTRVYQNIREEAIEGYKKCASEVIKEEWHKFGHHPLPDRLRQAGFLGGAIGYGGLGYAGLHGPAISSYAAPAISTYAAPAISTYAAAPIVTKTIAAPAIAAPAISTYAAAPIISKAIAAPAYSTYAAAPAISTYSAAPVISSYAAAPIVKSYAAPAISYAAPAVSIAPALTKSYSAPWGYSAGPAVAYGGLGYGYGAKYGW
ncbi:hypothetical protein EVAR_38489_1 [Eumeta japonica]|uniref:Uncharacterized protein n=1 Tax=Eumeta variegata TaxID=151549 RepID=A0A4C1WP90_EUMVA|nr:hypothetical protein EVAR_38489_1 [Eumeta japonica]